MGIKVKFNNKFLNDLVHDCNSGIVLEANRTKYVNISPFQLQNLTGFIREYLDSLVATYDPELSGIILSHQKIKVNPEFNVEGDGTNKLLYIADIYVFRPKIGSVLTGVVNQKSKDHVGCLVHRVFNVTIPKPDGDEEEEEVWNRTSVGQDVRFRVVAFDMTLKIPSIHGQILDSSTRQSSNALDVDHCLQEALGSQSESVTSDESDSKNDNLSNSSGVKSQKPNVVQGIGSENIDNNRLNESSLCKASLNTDRTSPSSRKCVEDSKNKRNHSLSLSLREAKVVNTEIDSDNFIPPSPVKPLKRSINVEKVSKDVDSEKNKEGTNFSNDEFEKTEEEKSAFNVSTSKITFRTRKNNLWNNDETFGNVSSFLKNLDSPQSCLRRSESPSSSNNSPATSDKHNRSVRFSSHDSVLRFDANTKGLSNHTSVRNSITQEESKSRNSSGSPKKMEVPEKKLSETIKSPPRSASPKRF
ncbi:DNA-directed RNA polymerase I subunit RPA43-like [Nilaparvata lugens]|uniref:DNA-directed RNA polymerase I subunit RPA43-like n=1 Tax=Nilaparvata lugens TaxID=108931 RepID=UPI00193EB9CE|nr:DNA-directed RNA polymerase I subunit RPA43-like [Nilaparvata lugens]